MDPGLETKKGIVYLIGAGPGDPGLITVRGRECLRRADAVVYDYLANPVLLREAPAGAERIYVGKTRGCHHRPQQEINELLARLAAAGRVVARLKGGDPYVFGRGGEEALYLSSRGIPFEVVPGVTAGFAAAAYAGIPLTHRDFTNTLGLITGHRNPAGEAETGEWESLAAGAGTLVFYMGMANLPTIAGRLLELGRPPSTPVALVRWATLPRQEVLEATLGDVVERVRAANFQPPAVILVGGVVGLRSRLRWFDNRPLFGRRVLVTRAADQAGALVELLEEAGAETVACPVIEIVPPPSWDPLDGAIRELDRTDLLVLTSANGVEAFFGRLEAAGLDARALHGVEVAAVGPKTGRAIAARGVRPDLVPEGDFRAEGLVALLGGRSLAGKRVLYPRAELARDLLRRELAAAGAEVVDPVAYRTLPPESLDVETREGLAGGEIGTATFTSPSTVDNLVALLGPPGPALLDRCALFSIGPQTTAALRRHGLTPAAEAEPFTLEGLVAAMTRYFAQTPESARASAPASATCPPEE